MIVEVYGIIIMIILSCVIGWNKGNFILQNNQDSYPEYSLLEFLMGKNNNE